MCLYKNDNVNFNYYMKNIFVFEYNLDSQTVRQSDQVESCKCLCFILVIIQLLNYIDIDSILE